MTVKEFYGATGGNYEDVLGRLQMEPLVKRFVLKFLNDGSYQLLCDSLAAGDFSEAFRAAHTLKGVSQNLSFTSLYEVINEMTELLRDCQPHEYQELLDRVTERYRIIIDAIGQLDA